MFKSHLAKGPVLLLLENMAKMQGLPGLSPSPQAISQPRFACVDHSSWKTYKYLELGYDLYVRCQSSAIQDNLLRFSHAKGTSYIFLCDDFQQLPVEPYKSICSTVEWNRFQGYQKGFNRNYQLYRTIYRLGRFYLGETRPRRGFESSRNV